MEIATIVFLAIFLEGTLNYLLGSSTEAPRPYIKYVALVAGIGLAIGYKVDIPSMVGLPFVPWLNYVLSGIAIGRGSNYLNDLVTGFQKKK